MGEAPARSRWGKEARGARLAGRASPRCVWEKPGGLGTVESWVWIAEWEAVPRGSGWEAWAVGWGRGTERVSRAAPGPTACAAGKAEGAAFPEGAVSVGLPGLWVSTGLPSHFAPCYGRLWKVRREGNTWAPIKSKFWHILGKAGLKVMRRGGEQIFVLIIYSLLLLKIKWLSKIHVIL